MKLCLIGSSRFKKLFEEYNRILTLQGHIVYSIATISTSSKFVENDSNKGGRIETEELPVGDKEILDLVHLRKILESDAVVLVTDSTGYYGDSTRREIRWARILGRGIFRRPGEIPSTGVQAPI